MGLDNRSGRRIGARWDHRADLARADRAGAALCGRFLGNRARDRGDRRRLRLPAERVDQLGLDTCRRDSKCHIRCCAADVARERNSHADLVGRDLHARRRHRAGGLGVQGAVGREVRR